MSTRPRNLLRFGLFGLIWVLLGVFLVRALDQMPAAEDWERLSTPEGLRAMGLFAACFAAALVLRAVRFAFLTRLTLPVPLHQMLLAFPWLFLLGAITPFRLGEGMRVHWVRQQGGAGAAAFGNWAAERWSDLVVLLTFLVLGLAPVTVAEMEGARLWVLSGAVAGGYLLFWTCRPVLRRAAERTQVGRDFSLRLLDSFSYMSDWRLHLTVMAMTGVIWLLMALGFWVALSLLLSASVPPAMALGCLAAVNLFALLSATPGNLVSFQAAVIAVAGAWGFGATDALVASVAIQSSGLAVAILAGLAARIGMSLEAMRNTRPPVQNG